jgi:hypothetical protein
MKKEFRFDLHTHTLFSDGMAKPEDVVKQAKRVGLDGLAITDHDTVKGLAQAKMTAKKIGITLIPGVEVTTHYGDLLALGVEFLPKGGLMEIIDSVHEHGGVVIIAHPFAGYYQLGFVDMIDIIKHSIDAVEIFNGNTPLELNKKARILAKKVKLPGIASSDAHFLEEVGSAFTVSKDDVVLKNIKKGDIRVGWV